jgi:hypothetical protein
MAKRTTVYNICGHNLLSYKLGYIAHHNEMERRKKKGEKQKKCNTCGLFLYKDELPTSVNNINRLP